MCKARGSMMVIESASNLEREDSINLAAVDHRLRE